MLSGVQISEASQEIVTPKTFVQNGTVFRDDIRRDDDLRFGERKISRPDLRHYSRVDGISILLRVVHVAEMKLTNSCLAAAFFVKGQLFKVFDIFLADNHFFWCHSFAPELDPRMEMVDVLPTVRMTRSKICLEARIVCDSLSLVEASTTTPWWWVSSKFEEPQNG